MSNKLNALFKSVSSGFAALAIPLELLFSILIYKYVLGNPQNFMGNDPANNPLSGNYLGIVYKGGIIVPILFTLFLLVITFTIERILTLRKSKGKDNLIDFVKSIKDHLNKGDIDAAKDECDEQRGSVANVLHASLRKYEEMDKNNELDIDKKILGIQKEIEEATHLEMPMLEKNLVIISTIASIATLMGLFGTVLGMIKAFAALAHAGAPDAVALANGISEALVNTALGIGTSALAIVFYNYFTNRIDNLTYRIDEAGYSIVQTFSFRHRS